MSNDPKHKTDPSQPMVYQIRIECHLDDQWADWFSGLTITLEENGDTLLTGPVADQAALSGLLKKVRDLGIPLVSVNRVEPGRPDMSSTLLAKGRNEMNEKMQITVDPDVKWLYRVGGIAAFVLVIGYFLTFPVYAFVGTEPTAVEARLTYFAQQATGWWVIAGLMVFTDLLMVPIWLALFQTLKGINKNVMLLAIVCRGLFIMLDLAVTWTAHTSFIPLGGNYAAATSGAQRAALVAAAGYPSTILSSPLLGLYAIMIPSTGVLLTSLVMLKGRIFNKPTAYLALATGISGVVFGGSYITSALVMFKYINALLATAWYLTVGFKLYKLGQQ